jgi:hypothetical protein
VRQAVIALTASTAMLAFVVALPPGTGEIAVASASVGTQDLPANGPMPPPFPALPPLPAPIAQDVATGMQQLQNLAENGDGVTPSDDGGDFDTTEAQEQEQQQQLDQDQSDQLQNQLNTNQLNDEQNQLNSQQLAQDQNDEAQQQVDDGLQQAQQDEINAGQ